LIAHANFGSSVVAPAGHWRNGSGILHRRGPVNFDSIERRLRYSREPRIPLSQQRGIWDIKLTLQATH